MFEFMLDVVNEIYVSGWDICGLGTAMLVPVVAWFKM